MKDIANTKLIYLKGILFLLGGIIASVILLIEYPNLKVAVLLAVSVWCFARSYYFAFYVIEHYVDNNFKFSGIWSFVCYLCRK
jgi:hypothetical protein